MLQNAVSWDVGHIQGVRKFFELCNSVSCVGRKLTEVGKELRSKKVAAIINK